MLRVYGSTLHSNLLSSPRLAPNSSRHSLCRALGFWRCGGAAAMGPPAKDESIQMMRSIVGAEFSEMDIVHSLHLARNDVQRAINILLDTPGFKNKPQAGSPGAAATRAKRSRDVNNRNHATTASPGVMGLPSLPEKKSSEPEDRESSSQEYRKLSPQKSPSPVVQKDAADRAAASAPNIPVIDLEAGDNDIREQPPASGGPNESEWWLLDQVVIEGFSTTKTSKLNVGDAVSFSFPKHGVHKKVVDFIRFSTAAAGEVGRLPGDWAKCLIPLVQSGKLLIIGSCKSAPASLSMMSTIYLSVSIYINKSCSERSMATESSLDVDKTTFRPLPSLLRLIGKSPMKKAEFTPDDLNDYRSDRPQLSNAQKRLKTDTSEAEDEHLSDAEVDRVVGTSDYRELQEMEEPEGLTCKLRSYQKQALFWMAGLEAGVTQEDAAKSLHPCWSSYALADRRGASFYVNSFSGEGTFDFPSALRTTKGGILADAMGLGKTVMTISLLLANRARNDSKTGGTLIVCPMTLLGQWQTELEKHVVPGTFSVYAFYGGDRLRDRSSLLKYDVVLTTYGVVKSEYSSNGDTGPMHSTNWFRIVLDEAHTIKVPSTGTAKAVFQLTSDRRLCLTGTPVQNKLEDLYSLFCFLRVEPWCNIAWWNTLIQKPYEGGDERALALLQAILKPLMLRRTKDSTDKDGRPILVLPTVKYEIIECNMTEAERDFYDALYRRSKVRFDQFVEQGRVLHNFASILELLLRLRQCCDHPFLVMSRADTETYADLGKLSKRLNGSNQEPSKAYVKEVVEEIRKGESSECPICLELPEDAVLTPCAHQLCRECLFNSWGGSIGGSCPICRQTVSRQELITVPTNSRFRINVEEQWSDSCKVKAFLEQLESLREAGLKCVVFTQWTAFLDLLEVPLKRNKFQYVRFDGKLTQPQRESTIKVFSSNPAITVMLVSLKAGGLGLNLTAASSAFILDPWWNPAVEEQAIMRVHRIGQTKDVSVKRFIVKGSVEERMQQVQARKQRLIAGALTSEEVRSARIEELKMLFR